MSSLAKLTKNELINLINVAQAQRAADIAELSARETTILALRNRVAFFEAEMVAPRGEAVEHVEPKTAALNVHDYADFKEARDNCRRLAASELNKRYSFTQVGIRVIAKMRATA